MAAAEIQMGKEYAAGLTDREERWLRSDLVETDKFSKTQRWVNTPSNRKLQAIELLDRQW